MKKNAHGSGKQKRYPSEPGLSDRKIRRIKVMAAMLRYPVPFLLMIQGCIWGKALSSKSAMLISMGVGLLCFGVYTLVGYCYEWRHVFCMYQNMYHQKMTPEKCDWGKIKKTDAYGFPTIFMVFGIGAIVAGILGN